LWWVEVLPDVFQVKNGRIKKRPIRRRKTPASEGGRYIAFSPMRRSAWIGSPG